jgi:hypothetical protein
MAEEDFELTFGFWHVAFHRDRVMKLHGKIAQITQTLPAWVTDIRDQCLRSKVPFFFKQWGGIAPQLNVASLVTKNQPQISQITTDWVLESV